MHHHHDYFFFLLLKQVFDDDVVLMAVGQKQYTNLSSTSALPFDAFTSSNFVSDPA